MKTNTILELRDRMVTPIPPKKKKKMFTLVTYQIIQFCIGSYYCKIEKLKENKNPN